jgi:hypothetical protein
VKLKLAATGGIGGLRGLLNGIGDGDSGILDYRTSRILDDATHVPSGDLSRGVDRK